MQDYVHLHVHTQFSLLDGQASVSNILQKAMADGMRGVAVTDHGNMMAIKEFFNTSNALISKAEKEVKKLSEVPENETSDAKAERELLLQKAKKKAAFMPIIGCEVYVARNSLNSKSQREDQSGNHLVLLAKNKVGYHNLIKIVSKAYVDGYYYRPRTDHDELKKHSEGLIVSTACLAGEVPSKILKGDLEGAEQSVLWFKEVFGDDFYLELQRHEVKDPTIHANREAFELQKKVNVQLIELSKKYGVKLICTNDVHFVDEEDAEAHDRLICLSTGKDLDDPKRMVYSKQEWFKTRAEMNAVFEDIPEALANTCEICDKVERYTIDNAPIMPCFPIPESFGTEVQYRQNLTEKNLFDEFTQDENGNVVLSQEDAEKKIKSLGGYDKLYRIKLEADYLAELTYKGAEKRYPLPLQKR